MKLIKLAFEISLPIDRYDHIYEKTWATPFKNKYFQVNAYQRNGLINFYMDWSIKEDHAGFMLEFDFLGFGASICLYDCRHWDYENDKFHPVLWEAK